MFLSVFDMFKVGIGPSSSHTMGPMVAAARFLDHLRRQPFRVAGLRASLHGSLAFTGVGHATDRAVILGLAGFTPEAYDHEAAEAALARIRETREVRPEGLPSLRFDPSTDLRFDYGPPLAGHANGLILRAADAQGDVVAEQTYYSIGGGFVLTAEELAAGKATDSGPPVPFPSRTRPRCSRMAAASGLSIAAMKRANELARRSAVRAGRGLRRIWDVMSACIDRGLAAEASSPAASRSAAAPPASTSRC
jgi:L-serine dehydratase